jgi:hypothetical protein
MRKSVDINWNSFRAKFNGREQEKFEELSYLLFCREHGQDYGILGYKNQTGIEKEPVNIDGKCVGFQAKYFNTKVSKNKDEMIGGIRKAKRENPNLDTLYYYLNQDFSESSIKGVKDPQYKKQIENCASSIGVEIVWKTPSQLQAQLRLDNHLSIAEYFFDLKPGLIDAIMNIQQHKDPILQPIKTQIEYSGRVLKIDRSATISIIENELKLNSVLVISGDGGTGKTAIVKELLSLCQSCISYVFKANEFNVSSLHEFFNKWGDVTLLDFLNEHQNAPCLVVIDSAERLSDIDDLSPFFELFEALLKSKWCVIFTTRNRYYSDLMYLLNEQFKCNPGRIEIPLLEADELQRISREHEFALPSNCKLIDLIRTPYYLQAYLDNYQDIGCNQDYKGFFEYLWTQKVMRSQSKKDGMHILRSDCMLQIVKNKAESGCFYIDPNSYNKKAIELLNADEVLGYDESILCYFIAHDVIEELALRKLLDKKYALKSSIEGFFESIGSSLIIRRAFRAWLLDRIESEPEQVRLLIGATLSQSSLSAYWRDESFISILTSTKANEFFNSIETKLTENNFELMYRLTFLLRTACKEYDSSVASRLMNNNTSEDYLKHVFTQPKGQGWDFTINFIFKHRESLKNWRIIVPLLQDWTRKHRQGSTTSSAGKIALYKYEELMSDDHSRYIERDIEDQLVNVILNSAGEIKDELSGYFESVLIPDRPRTDKLVETLLTSLIDSIETVKALPLFVEKLAWLYWVAQPRDKEDDYGYRGYEIETDFGLSSFCEHSYHPESALQTPVYLMLRYHPISTIDFIIKLTNHSVETYVNSDRGKYGEDIVLFIEGTEYKQHIDCLLWNLYRGASGGPELMQSIHMALEKWLLELAEEDDGKLIEAICKDLLKKSVSASITAVVVSVILAHPNKTYNLAAVLFKVPQLFIYDTRRFVADQTIRSLYSIGYGYDAKDYLRDERLKTCEDNFRKQSLEHIALNYQLISYDDEAIFEQRRSAVWGILDEHYANLPPEQDQNESDKTWRTYLARMDSRKMELKIESQDGNKTVVSLNPSIDPKLKEHNEKILTLLDDQNRFISLKMWAESRFRNEQETYMKYDQYNSDLQRVILETKEVVAELQNECDDTFDLFYKNLPAYSCSVLIRDYSDTLSQIDGNFCKDVIMSYVSGFSKNKRAYQIGDGSEPAISTLPVIMEKYPDLRNSIKDTLLKMLLHESSLTEFVKKSIQSRLWDISPDDASSVLIAYAIIDDGYEKYRRSEYKKRLSNHSYSSSFVSIEEFWDTNTELISRFVKNELTLTDIDIEGCNHRTLISTIELLPIKIGDDELKHFFVSALTILAKRFYDDRNRDNQIRLHRLMKKICPMVLFAERQDTLSYITPFIEHFQFSADSYQLFSQLISVEYRYPQYDNFWYIWDQFFEKISDLSGNIDRNRDARETIKYYLLAHPYWNAGTTEWHSIREKERLFYDRVVSKMGHASVVLYSIAKVLNDVGSQFALDGVTWLSSMIIANKYIELERYTIEYIEKFIRRFILSNRKNVKRDKVLRDKVICILDFLFEKGSIIGFLLREDIL